METQKNKNGTNKYLNSMVLITTVAFLAAVVFLVLNSLRLNETEQRFVGNWVLLDEKGTYNKYSTFCRLNKDRTGIMTNSFQLFQNSPMETFDDNFNWSVRDGKCEVEFPADFSVQNIFEDTLAQDEEKLEIDFVILKVSEQEVTLLDSLEKERYVFKRLPLDSEFLPQMK